MKPKRIDAGWIFVAVLFAVILIATQSIGVTLAMAFIAIGYDQLLARQENTVTAA